LVLEKLPDGSVAKEVTWWATIRDLKNRIYYFRAFENMNFRKAELNRPAFSGGKVKVIPRYDENERIIDLTARGK
jgi:hypothetical protein